MRITSTQNPRIKSLLRLRNRRSRDREQKFLIEGFRELTRAQAAGFPVETVFFCPAWFQGANERALLERCRAGGAELIETSREVFARVSYRDRPEGLLAVAPQQRRGLEALPPARGKARFILVAEGIEKPGNLGTILRSADAAGVDAVIVCDGRTDIYNPNTVRASIGTLFTVPVLEAESRAARARLRREGIRILAASPGAARVYTEVDCTGDLAIAVGSEQYGLTPEWIEGADLPVRIPMAGVADSLNVSAAAIVLLYEVVRQRRAGDGPANFQGAPGPELRAGSAEFGG